MKRHVQETGIRKWFGDDLIELQNQPLKAIDDFFKPYASCVISGCEVSGATINPGLIAFVWDSGGQRYAKVVPFAGASGVSVWPQYLYLEETALTREYQSGGVKNIAIESKAAITTTIPAFPYVRILAAGPEKTFRDVIQTSSYRFVTDAQIANWNDKPTLTAFNTHTGDTTAHITSNERTSWNDKVASGTFNTHNGDNTRHITAAERILWNKAWTTDNFSPANYYLKTDTVSKASKLDPWNDPEYSIYTLDWNQSMIYKHYSGHKFYATVANFSFNDNVIFHAGNLNKSDVDFNAKFIQAYSGIKASKATAPTSISKANHYLSLGGGEWGVNSYRLIGFGCAGTHQPAYVGYVETTDAGSTQGDLIFGTRAELTDTLPSERVRIKSNGYMGIGISTPRERLHVLGNMVLDSNGVGIIRGNNYDLGNGGAIKISTSPSSAADQYIQFGRALSGAGAFTPYLTVQVSTSCIGIGTTSPNYPLEVVGNIVGTNIGSSSDLRWKKNIKPYNGVLSKLLQMQMVSFRWKDKKKDQRINLGYVSQNIKPLFPELILTDAHGYMSLEYPKFGVLAIEGLKELRNDVYHELYMLRQEISELRSLLNK